MLFGRPMFVPSRHRQQLVLRIGVVLMLWPSATLGWHPSAAYFGKQFLDALEHLPWTAGRPIKVLEVGSYDVNGGMRRYAPTALPSGFRYIGVDINPGPGVDVVLEDPYVLPFPNGSFHATFSTSAFEHVDFFWLLFLEMVRVTIPEGFVYLNIPSDLADHSDEVPPDSWRFLHDAGGSLERWAKRNGYPNVHVMQSFVSKPTSYQSFGDSVHVFALQEAADTGREVALRKDLPESENDLFDTVVSSNSCWSGSERYADSSQYGRFSESGTQHPKGRLSRALFCCNALKRVHDKLSVGLTTLQITMENKDMLLRSYDVCKFGSKNRTFDRCCTW
eukprot:gnl/TRDRNA2_/TRDRNA2_75167_c0_seq1.p1 gnl/TRDRNA2_/TRDRNA2_75167_c0~~gnl/TRDRNA2_/TRDRNA2_75167_c0_seq1.p1  ORF type:complete len:334 (+),score=21.31 gnl/TRDRNA2_/TRDRNA2_75167_c0_seq1:62-1063(+)